MMCSIISYCISIVCEGTGARNNNAFKKVALMLYSYNMHISRKGIDTELFLPLYGDEAFECV